MRTTAPRRSEMVTRSWGWRDLRRSAGILSRAATVKTKKQSIAGIFKRKKPASASSEAVKILAPSELLKLKKKAFEAQRLWDERDVPGALERWKAAEEAAAAEEEEAQPEKRKRLVIRRLPDALIHVMKKQPFLIKPIPAQELQRLDSMSYGFAETYHMRKFIDDKMYAYEQALINQHNLLGYAEDVDEVTDDEQE